MTFDIDEEHLKLANMKLPALTEKQKSRLNQVKKNLLNEIIEFFKKRKCNDNKNNCTIGWFYQNHKGKIYLRGFMIAYEMDFRLKNPIKNEYFYECYRQSEDLERPVVKGCYDVYDSYNWSRELRYAPNDDWHTQRGTNTLLNYGNDLSDKQELECIASKHNILKYIKESIIETENLLDLLQKLKKYPALEFVRKCGFVDLENNNKALRYLSSNSKSSKAFKKFLFKMYSKGKVKESYEYYKWYYDKYKFDIRDLDCRRILWEIASQKEWSDGHINWKDRIEWKVTPEEIARLFTKNRNKYIVSDQWQKQDIAHSTSWVKMLWNRYKDYLSMALQLGHDINDRYWQLPKDVTEAHDKCCLELTRLRELEEQNKLKAKQKKLQKVVAKYQEFNTQIDGYDIFVPNDYAVIKPHIEALHQCILTASYDEKMIRGESILIFVQKNQEPICSVEIDYNKNILQAYTDEHDRNNCKPSEELMVIINKYLEVFNPNPKVKDKNKNRRELEVVTNLEENRVNNPHVYA